MRAKTLDYTDRDSARSWQPPTVKLIVIRLVTAVAFLLLAAPLATEGQLPEKIARIGMLRSEHRPLDDRTRQNIAALRAGLQDGGYAEGQHYRIDYHSPTSEADVVKLARTLVRDRVDVIHASAYTAIHAAQKVTTTIPIVAHDYETDPIAAGFVATLARPGGNITGMFLDLPEISGKLLELLKTALPGLRRIGVLWDSLTGKAQVIAVERAAKALGIEINILEARAGSLEQTVRFAQDRKASALLLLGSPVLSAEFPRIAAGMGHDGRPVADYRSPSPFTGRHRTDLGCPLCYADDERTRRRGLHSAVASSHKTNPRRDAAQRLLRQHDRDRRLCRRRVTPLLSLRRRGRSIIPRKRGLLTGRESGKLLAEEPEHVSERFCCSWRDILTHLPFVWVWGVLQCTGQG